MVGYGYTPYFNPSLLNVAAEVKADEGKLQHLEVQSLNLAESWFMIFNHAIADVEFGSITAVANHADGAKYTKVAHGLAAGDEVVHEGFTDTTYNGEKTVITIVDADNYTTSDTYTATGTGTYITKPAFSFRIPYGDGVAYYGSFVFNVGDLGVDFETAISIFASTSPCGIAAPTNGLVVNIAYQ